MGQDPFNSGSCNFHEQKGAYVRPNRNRRVAKFTGSGRIPVCANDFRTLTGPPTVNANV
jgi:hypothetical protein